MSPFTMIEKDGFPRAPACVGTRQTGGNDVKESGNERETSRNGNRELSTVPLIYFLKEESF